MPDRRYYYPVARGLEIQIGEKLEELARKNRQHRKSPDSSKDKDK
jgi:hypothetical protein